MVLHLSLTLPIPVQPKCTSALSKQGERLISSLDSSSSPTETHRLITKFVASSSKSVALATLSHLLSPKLRHRHSSLALTMYQQVTQTSWFSWNSKLVSNVIASLTKQGFDDEAEILIHGCIRILESRGDREKEIAMFYSDLIHVFSKYGCKESFVDYSSRLKRIIVSCSSFNSRKAFEAMINGYSNLDLPREAEVVVEEMRDAGIRVEGFELRSILLAYGRLGLLSEMKRVLDQMEKFGCKFDTICFNMVLSCYGAHGELSEMVLWIEKMKSLNIPLSVRTYNSVLNSCPTIISLIQHPKSMPLSIRELMENLQRSGNEEEALLIRRLMDSSVLVEKLEWKSMEGKLDLHGMHLGSVYVIMLQWIEELRLRLYGECLTIPSDITVVCGLGKHSCVRRVSPVKALVSEMMVRLQSPMKIQRNNVGCFVAKGRNVRKWLLTLNVVEQTTTSESNSRGRGFTYQERDYEISIKSVH